MTSWRRSSRSGTGGQSNCVEVARLSGDIAIRDSKSPAGPRFTLSADDFRRLAADIRRGTHDAP
ncbi:protein of unknown function [Actinomadura mexicana]|uniref:DUF397 domain-containing protein n=2 Tax=Actinomadura mexicana TaxID=134959 RepID=A0A239D313_9ACTN|nr:DUF397 domain-containing protein [Actinomadura mexicana]SNS26214.1 protein of unknown function [Actinomadura mexicana]